MEVFIDRCSNYKKVKPVIQKAIDDLGGIKRFVKEGETILVKPNLLQGKAPEKAVSTHPDFIIAVVQILEEAGVDVIVGDSPGGPFTERRLKKAYKKAGWDRVENETDARLNYDTDKLATEFPPGKIIKNIDTIAILYDVDGVINLPKLKTHSLTVFTGAVKNMYGCVHGITKSAYHGQYRGVKNFSKMLLDVNSAVNPRLSIMDGILGMQGSGPASGDPVRLDMVIASSNSTACDIAACQSVGIPIRKVKTITQDSLKPSEVKYTNLTPDDVKKQIKYPKGGYTPWWAPDFLAQFLANIYLDRPELDRSKCTRCGKCLEICSQDAIKMKTYGPKISWYRCIRCYCCSEVCPEEALKKD